MEREGSRDIGRHKGRAAGLGAADSGPTSAPSPKVPLARGFCFLGQSFARQGLVLGDGTEHLAYQQPR
jgi:hypothetical protein